MEVGDYRQTVRERLESVDPRLAERVLALEVRWEAVIPTLATRESVERLRGEMHQSIDGLRRWVIGTAIGMGAIALSGLGWVIPLATQRGASGAAAPVHVAAATDALPPAILSEVKE